MTRSRKPRILTAHITYLEMRARLQRHVPVPARPRLALMRAPGMPLSFYRYLYDAVGRGHHWLLRRKLDDAALSAIIHAETTKISVLYADGSPAGFYELDCAGLPDFVELAYFGLTADHTGLGLGKWFLAAAIDAAWEEHPVRVTVHTNTLDHPAALPLYQKMGFEPVGSGVETVAVWE